MTEHPDIFKKADHGELHKYALLRETTLMYTIQRLKHLAKKKNFDSKKSKIRKKLNKLVLFFQPISLFIVIIILFNKCFNTFLDETM